MDFVWIRLFTAFSLKNRSLLKNPRGLRHFAKPQMFLSFTNTDTHVSRNTYHPEYIITFCAKSYYILRYGCYYILRRKLLHFALLLHFVAKVITFCVTITFCVSYYNMWRNNMQSSFVKSINFLEAPVVLTVMMEGRVAKHIAFQKLRWYEIFRRVHHVSLVTRA